MPGIEDIINGGYIYTDRNGQQKTAPSVEERMRMGRLAAGALSRYNKAKASGDSLGMRESRAVLEENFDHFGYAYINDPVEVVPNVPFSMHSE